MNCGYLSALLLIMSCLVVMNHLSVEGYDPANVGWGCSPDLIPPLIPSIHIEESYSVENCSDDAAWTCVCMDSSPTNARQTACLDLDTNKLIPVTYCNSEEQPETIQPEPEGCQCEEYTGEWVCVEGARGVIPIDGDTVFTSCSDDHFSTCENDSCCSKERTVVCVGETGNPSTQCDPLTKPTIVEHQYDYSSCGFDYLCVPIDAIVFDASTLGSCDDSAYASECSTKCGEGTAQRHVVCASQYNKSLNGMNNEACNVYCDGLVPPQSSIPCTSYDDCMCEDGFHYGENCGLSPHVTNVRLGSTMVTPYTGEEVSIRWEYTGPAGVMATILMDLSNAVQDYPFPIIIASIPADTIQYTYHFDQTYNILIKATPTARFSVVIPQSRPSHANAEILSKCSRNHPNPLVCQRGGPCNDHSQQCICDSGYTGVYCEQDVCDGYECLNGGECIITPAGNAQCRCEAPFTGMYCHLNTDCVDERSCNSRGYVGSTTNGICDKACTCDGYWADTKDDVRGGCLECGLACPPRSPANRDCTACACQKGYSGTTCNCRHIQGTIYLKSSPQSYTSATPYQRELLLRSVENDIYAVATARDHPIPPGKLRVLYMGPVQSSTQFAIIIQIQATCSASFTQFDLQQDDTNYQIKDAYDSYQAIVGDISAPDSIFLSSHITASGNSVDRVDAIYDPNCTPSMATQCPNGPEPPFNQGPDGNNGGNDGDVDSDSGSSLASDWMFWVILLLGALLLALIIAIAVVCLFKREQCFGRYKRHQELHKKKDIEMK